MAKIEEEKAGKDEMNYQIYQLKREVEDLKNELLLAEQSKNQADKNKEILAQLYEHNIIHREVKPI